MDEGCKVGMDGLMNGLRWHKTVPVSIDWFQSGTVWFQAATSMAQNGPRSAHVGHK